MGFIKKYGMMILLCLSLQVKGQDNEKLINAFKESYQLEKNGDYKQAADKLVSVYDAGSYEMNLRLGWLNYLAGLFNESTAYYSKACKLMPYSIEARLGIVLPASALGKWDEVISQYNKILEIDPNHSLTNYRLGLFYYGRAEYQKAHDYFEKVVNMYPFDGDSLIMLAWAKFQLHDYRQAKVLFHKMLLYDPGNESAKEGLKLIK